MPATTRRSTRRVQAPKHKHQEPTSDYSDSELSSLSEEEDYEEKRPAKRPRKSATSPVKPRTSQAVSLLGDGQDRISSLSLDVLFQMFTYMEPMDLLILARTSKAFRNTLMTKKAAVTWKASLKHAGAPDMPTEMSGPRWANLLFGGNKCEVCGTPGVSRIDFALRRRVCIPCLREKLLRERKVSDTSPHLDLNFLDYIPYSNCGPSSHGHANKSRYFWDTDIAHIQECFESLQDDIDAKKPGAVEAMSTFKAERTKFVEDVINQAPVYSNWFDEFIRNKHGAADDRHKLREDEVVKRFEQLGYLEKDIRWTIRVHSLSKSTVALNDNTFKRIRNRLEPEVKNQRISRQKPQREKAINDAYVDFCFKRPPSEHIYMPSLKKIMEINVIDAVLKADREGDVTPEECSNAIAAANLAAFIKNWKDKRAQYATDLVRKSDYELAKSVSLDLAIFKCSDTPRNPIFGIEGFVVHDCDKVARYWGTFYHYETAFRAWQPSRAVFSFDATATACAVSLARLLGLDPTKASFADMDKEQKVFVEEWTKGQRSVQVYDWRQAVAHSLEPTMKPVFRVFTDDDAGRFTVVDVARTPLLWSCLHCFEHFGKLETKAKVIEHIKQHGIPDPQEGVDFFYNAPIVQSWGSTKRRVYEPPPPPPEPTPEGHEKKEWVCLKCPNQPGKAPRLFQWHGVKEHLHSPRHTKEKEVLKRKLIDGVDYARRPQPALPTAVAVELEDGELPA